MRVTLVSLALACAVVGCSIAPPHTNAPVRLPSDVSYLGDCSASIEIQYRPVRVCTDASDAWKRLVITAHIGGDFHGGRDVQAVLWVPPNQDCNTNPNLLDIREVNECRRFSSKID